MIEIKQPEEFLPLSKGKKAVIFLFIAFAIGYFVWRASSTINEDRPIYSWSFFAIDLWGFLNSLLFMAVTWKLSNRKSLVPKGQPTVDVYITTYNEGVELLRTTLYHAMRMDYPHETYILDDGRRPEVRKLADEFGAKYITRSDNKGAKAGNLNHALTQTKGELIAIFDADGVPRKDFLQKLVGYFNDPLVALVQTPNAFYNLDSFQHWYEDANKRVWNEQSLWFDVIQRGLDYGDASAWCGNGAVFRRSSLAEVGGIATDSVTEDTYTTLKLHDGGFKTVFHDEPIAFCLAPTSIAPYLVQRGRWALGSIQTLRMGFSKIFTSPKMNFKQRLAYLTIGYYFTVLQKLFYYIAPLLYLEFDVAPVRQPDIMLAPLAVYMVLSIASFKFLARGSGRVFRGDRYFLYLVPIYLKAIFLGLNPFFRGKFHVTSKDPGTHTPFRFWVTPAAVLGISAWALYAGLYKLGSGQLESGVFLTTAVSVYYIISSFNALVNIKKSPVSEETYSFFDYRPIQIKSRGDVPQIGNNLGVAFVISDKFLQTVHTSPARLGDKLKFDLDLPDANLSLEAEVSRVEPWVIPGLDPLYLVEMKLENLSNESRDELVRYFFEDATPRLMQSTAMTNQAHGNGKMPEGQRRQKTRLPTLLPVLIGEDENNLQIGLLTDFSNSGARLKLARAIENGKTVRIQMPWIKKVEMAKVVRCQREAGQINPPYDIGIVFGQALEMEEKVLAQFEALKLAV